MDISKLKQVDSKEEKVDYPPFNKAHPPLMEKLDIWPPQRTAGEMIGKPFDISHKYFYGVHDSQFPWVGMTHSSPDQSYD